MIEPEQIKHRGVQVVDVHFLLDRRDAVLVGRAVAMAAFDAAAGHPHRKAGRVMVAPVAVLRPGRAAEFTSPHDQRVFEHVALFQVGQQCGNRLVDRVAIRG